MLAPVFASLWTKLGRHNPSTVYKFALGAIFAGLSYLVMIIPLNSDAFDSPYMVSVKFLLITLVNCVSRL